MTIDELIEELLLLSPHDRHIEDRVDFLWDDCPDVPLGRRNITFIDVHQHEPS
jgi:hypothetical protein